MQSTTKFTNCREFIQKSRDLINQTLEQIIQDQKDNDLYQAARYSTLGDGKRIRPILSLAVTETFKGSKESAIYPACAIELIHTYSLIHDDLPCMNDDDYRRGKPTLHKVYPESYAVLTGDFLLTQAFEILACAPNITDSQRVKLIKILSKSAGGDGMVGGQLLDIKAENKVIDLESLENIHKRKTGALITAAIDFGAVLSHATFDDSVILHDFGNLVGHAFQIIDDVIDAGEEFENPSSDIQKNKPTYTSLLGLKNAKKAAMDLLEQAQNKLSEIKHETSLLNDLAKELVHRNR